MEPFFKKCRRGALGEPLAKQAGFLLPNKSALGGDFHGVSRFFFGNLAI